MEPDESHDVIFKPVNRYIIFRCWFCKIACAVVTRFCTPRKKNTQQYRLHLTACIYASQYKSVKLLKLVGANCCHLLIFLKVHWNLISWFSCMRKELLSIRWGCLLISKGTNEFHEICEISLNLYGL